METYTCAQCGNTYETDQSDKDAKTEMIENGWTESECDIVCDDCYNKVMNWAKTQEN